jgi:hypothetical protein
LSTTVLGGASLILVLTTTLGFSFLSLPVLLSVLTAEVLAPEPRRGRLRTAMLSRRRRSYFAPAVALRTARLLMAAALGCALAAVTQQPSGRWALHACVMASGALIMEISLERLTQRGLPDRLPDLPVDTAIRVASARSLTAAGLVFSTFGLLYGLSPVLTMLHIGHTGGLVLNQLLNLALPGIGIWATVLVSPKASWHAPS